MWQHAVYFVWFGVFIQVLGSAAYIRDTLRGKTKPNRVTWLMWSIAPLIGAAAAISNGVKWVVLPVVVAGIIPLLVLMASFMNKQAYWRLSFFDYACGLFSALALALWFLTSEPMVAIWLAIAADAVAALPTLSKAWTNPETETSVEYLATVAASFFGLLAAESWRTAETAFPIYLMLLNGIVILVIYRQRLIFSTVK
jgi:hypothetical protein